MVGGGHPKLLRARVFVRGVKSRDFVQHANTRGRVRARRCVAQPMLLYRSRDSLHLSMCREQWTSFEAAMNPRHYVDLKDSSRDLQPTYYFMINCLLYSRMETGLVSNQDCYDEDVNVYLAHLLHSFINPE